MATQKSTRVERLKSSYCLVCQHPYKEDFTTHVVSSPIPHNPCHRCSVIFKSEETLQNHLMSSSQHHICVCCNPALDFESPAELAEHQKRWCEYCNVKCTSVKTLQKHKKRMHTCTCCTPPEQVANEEERAAHVKQKAQDAGLWCDFCKLVLENKETVAKHLDFHLREPKGKLLSCTCCTPPKQFENRTRLSQHRGYFCIPCQKIILTGAVLERHKKESKAHITCGCCTPVVEFATQKEKTVHEEFGWEILEARERGRGFMALLLRRCWNEGDEKVRSEALGKMWRLRCAEDTRNH